MYLPPHFREDNIEVQHGLIRAYPLGLLVTAGAGGLMANPIPMTLEADVGTLGTLRLGTLRMHLARANPQLEELADGAECLVVFQGPQAYISPSYYATKAETHKVVPTWNYATVHVWGKPHVHDDAAWVRAQIERLTQDREQARAAPWAVGDAPTPFIAAQIRGIVGVEIPLHRIEGKWKVSQNRTEADRAGVHAGLVAENDKFSGQMAQLVGAHLPSPPEGAKG